MARPPIAYFRDFCADTAVFGAKAALACGLGFFGPRNALFGTDFPFDPEGGARFARLGMRHIGEMGLEPDDFDAVTSGNINRLIGRLRAGANHE